MLQGNLYIISAPSGAGKSSLISALLKRANSHKMMVSVSHTTRPPRPGEQEGVHYYFVSHSEFEDLIAQHAFLEYAKVFGGNYYGTSLPAIEENLAKGILSSKYFEDLKKSWQDLDIAVVGIGGFADENNRQWLDMLTERDFSVLKSEEEVGEICCRFFDKNGEPVYEELQERTIAISLSELKKIPHALGFAYGSAKATAILSVLRAGYINHLVTDEETILKVLSLDGDNSFT